MTLGYGKSTVIINSRHTDYLNCRFMNCSRHERAPVEHMEEECYWSIAVDTTAPTRHPTVAVHVAQLTSK
jgi:hypothetical protein